MTEDHLCTNLLIGVSGSIHALQLPTYLVRFREALAPNVTVIMTRNAQRMISPETVRLYTDDRVFVDLWDRSTTANRAAHIQLTRWADLFIILPATANILGKAAHGIADDLLSTAILSSPRPVVFAPAMNPAMWQSPAVKRNVRILQEDGHYIVPPERGISVTSGEWDLGLAPSPEALLPHLQHVRMKLLKEEYWEEATREKPRTQAQMKIQELVLATAMRANDNADE